MTTSQAKPVILVVDDEPAVLDVLVRDLEDRYAAEYDVIGAHAGQEALEAFDILAGAGRTVSLVVSDQKMPGMSGTQVLSEVRRRSPDTRLGIITAHYDDNRYLLEMLDLSIDLFLRKPWGTRLPETYGRIDAALKNHLETLRRRTERHLAGGFAHTVRNKIAPIRNLAASLLGVPGTEVEGRLKALEGAPALLQALLPNLEEALKRGPVGDLKPEHLPALAAKIREFQAANEGVQTTVLEVDRCAEEALAVVTGILGFARLEAAFHPEDTPVRPLLEKCSERMRGLWERDRITLACEAEEATLHLDASQIGAVLENLLNNAREAILEARQTRPDAGRVTVKGTRHDSEGTYVISVADDGIGLSEEVRRRLFTPFFSTKPSNRGAGLGLVESKRIAELHGGRLEPSECRPFGTAFSLTLALR